MAIFRFGDVMLVALSSPHPVFSVMHNVDMQPQPNRELALNLYWSN